MQYYDVFGNTIKWKPSNSPRENASKNHLKAVQLILATIPNAYICEECNIPLGIRGKNLYLDIYLPHFNIAIEVDGRQHEVYVAHFHGDKMNFLTQKKNDRLKQDWCDINNITLVKFKETETIDQWRINLVGCFDPIRRE